MEQQTTFAVLTIEQIREIVRLTIAQMRCASTNDQQPLVTLTASEVKQLYDVSDSTLWRWQRAGLVHPVRIGRERRYDRREIEAMFPKY